MRTIITIIISLLVSPLISFAAASPVITDWNDPAESFNYAFDDGINQSGPDEINVNGKWSLPTGWAGNIYVYIDGVQVSDPYSGKTFYTIRNIDGASPTGSFSFPTGPRADGQHSIYLKFVGGLECALNQYSNDNFGTNYPPTSTCQSTADNNIIQQTQTRNFTVALPLYPRMVISPSTNPALTFMNTEYGASSNIQYFTIENTGSQGLTGKISGLPAEFSCAPSTCTYTVNPGQTISVGLTYTPKKIGENIVASLSFECNETGGALGCEGVSSAVTAIQTRNITASSVKNAKPPVLHVNKVSIDYGTVNLSGAPATPNQNFNIKNTGDGFLNGTVSFSDASGVSTPRAGTYSCLNNSTCSFSLPSGAQTTITIVFFPTTAGNYSGTAGDIAIVDVPSPLPSQSKNVRINSIVNNLPIVNVFNTTTGVGDPINFGRVNVGDCSAEKSTWIRNAGAGSLSGAVTLSSSAVNAGFSCVSGCNYSGYTNPDSWKLVQLKFCPTASGVGNRSETVVFTNSTNPTKGGTLNISANGNNSPIGVIKGTNQFNFGAQLVGGGPYYASVDITNIGVGNLSGSVGALPFPGIHTCKSGCTYNIPPRDVHRVTLTFSPVAVQAYGGNVTLSGIGSVYIWASGVQPNFQMSYSGSPWTSCPGATCVTQIPRTLPSQGAYDVGVTTFGGSPLVQNKTFYLYVANKGNGAAKATYDLTTGNTPHFVCQSLCKGTLNSGEAKMITYQFQPGNAPGGPGTYTEQLLVIYNNGGGGDIIAKLNLTAKSESKPYLSISPFNIELGNVAVADSSVATFRVANLGFGNLNGTVTIPGAGPSTGSPVFTCVVPTCTITNLAPFNGTGPVHEVKIKFSPTTAQTYIAYPTFLSDGGNYAYPSTPYPSIRGTGVKKPIIGISIAGSPPSISFGNTNQGRDSDFTFSIHNNGRGDLIGNVSPVSGPTLSFYCIAGCNFNIPEAQSRPVTIRFSPQSATFLRSKIIINSNASNSINSPISGQVIIDVSGRGELASIILANMQTDYGSVIVNKTKQLTFEMTNSGNLGLGSGTFVLTAGKPFTCIAPTPCNYNLGPGDSAKFTVLFSPTAVGSANTVVSLSGFPGVNLNLTGTGVPPTVKFIER